MPDVSVPDAHIHRFGPADGPLVLALHGLTGHGLRWADLAENHLPEARVIAPDLRGHGLASGLPPWTYEQIVDDLAGLLTEPAVVLAHSFGGAVAVHLARRHPERIRALVLLDPASGLDPRLVADIAAAGLARPDYADIAEARTDKLHTAWADVAPELLENELAQHLVPTADGRVTWRMSLPAVTSYWGQLARELVLPPPSIPTVLVRAAKAPFVTDATIEAFATVPDFTVHEFDCDHMIAQARPAETAAIVRSVL
ncbi:alpha/beta fold hydrolase [Nocardia nova]|uniref:alpha/beta fold hydrolase n=1 Tax=Nocardia nova TaxID=37330 RepID=UPI0033FC6370